MFEQYGKIENDLNMDFDYMQLQEVKAGIEDGLDTSYYADTKYVYLQMKEIRKGLKSGIDVNYYADPQYDWFQMQEIRKGLECGVDITEYAKKDYGYKTMREMRKGLEKGIRLSQYVKKGFNTEIVRQVRKAYEKGVNLESYCLEGYDSEQLEEIRRGLTNKIDIKPFLNQEYSGSQMREIRLGIEQGLDVKKYADLKYNWMQMRELRLGLEKGLWIFWYEDSNFSGRQMREIRLGLEEGKDVSKYASFMYSAKEMSIFRKSIVINKRDEEIDDRFLEQREEAEEVKISNIKVLISKDEMEAYIRVDRSDENIYTEDLIMTSIQRAGVRYGIREDVVKELVANMKYDEEILVARGHKAQHGSDGYFAYNFKTQLPYLPKDPDSEAIDFEKAIFYELVNEEDTLAVYTAATAGEYGYTVRGQLILPDKGENFPKLRGNCFEVEDDCIYKASAEGRVELCDNELIIYPVYSHEGTLEAGDNVEFDGDILIDGDVEGGAVLMATGNIVINGNVEDAMIRSGSNIYIRGNVNSTGQTEIIADGSIYGDCFKKATLRAEKNIEANNIINCYCEATEKVLVYGWGGTIAGGTVLAMKGIETANIGNAEKVKTRIEIGKNQLFTKKIIEYKEERASVEEAIKSLAKEILRYKKRYSWETLDRMSLYNNIEMAQMEAKGKYDLLTNQLEKFATMRTDRSISVRVRNAIYPGSMIKVDNMGQMINDKIGRSIVRSDGKRMVILKNYMDI